MRVLSRREEGELVAFLLTDTDSYKLGVFLSLYTGIRIGELCALQWKGACISEALLYHCQYVRNTFYGKSALSVQPSIFQKQ